jgi:glycosyltransferase involved in cell wall biosynthesis
MRISTIIPVYNGKKYLREAVESVFKQTLQPMELIVVDDGSTDNSLDVIQGIEASFPVRLIKQKNAGQSAARNHGVRVSQGDFIALLDQDDVWYAEHLEKLAEPFKDDESLGWVYSNLDGSDENGRVIHPGLLDQCKYPHPRQTLKEMVQSDLMILPSASLIRKKAFLEVGMFDERLSGYEDDDLFLRLALNQWKQKYIPERLSQWRAHPNSCGLRITVEVRNLFFQKVGELCSTSLFEGLALEEILGERLYFTAVHNYTTALNRKEFSRCDFIHQELAKYEKLTPKSAHKFKKGLTFLRKFPRLFWGLSQVKRTLFH